MPFLPAEFIRTRKRAEPHSREEIETFIDAYVRNALPESQVAAWLMATCFNPLSARETAWLTTAMAASGKQLKFKGRIGRSVDKHSTGGIGDKTSLIIAPLVAAAGVQVPMMAGRGLGHTGGTLDKLESIAGFRTRLSLAEFEAQVARIGVGIVGQTEEICPADRRMYSLRDVTGTVDSLPLICASIMSKKIAEGCEALVLDVKFGSGAFMKAIETAEELALALKQIGREAGLQVTAVLTNMNEPLGTAIGNALEVEECLRILKGEVRDGAVRDLSLELSAQMLELSGRCATRIEARSLAENLLDSRAAWDKFSEIVREQGGDLNAPLPRAKIRESLKAERNGFVHFTDLEQMGLGAIVLGAGRKLATDTIDFAAGVEVLVREGQEVKKGDALLSLHSNNANLIREAEAYFQRSLKIVDVPAPTFPLIAKVLV